jgi:hypothetical protein
MSPETSVAALRTLNATLAVEDGDPGSCAPRLGAADVDVSHVDAQRAATRAVTFGAPAMKCSRYS